MQDEAAVEGLSFISKLLTRCQFIDEHHFGEDLEPGFLREPEL